MSSPVERSWNGKSVKAMTCLGRFVLSEEYMLPCILDLDSLVPDFKFQIEPAFRKFEQGQRRNL